MNMETVVRDQIFSRANEFDSFLASMTRQSALDKAKFSTISSLGEYVWHVRGDWVLCNNAIQHELGYCQKISQRSLTREFFLKMLHPDDFGRVCDIVNNFMQGKFLSYEIELRMKNHFGYYKWYYHMVYALDTNEKNEPLVAKGIILDITPIKKKIAALEQRNSVLLNLLQTDDVTSLCSRRALLENFEREINRVKRSNNRLCILMCDLDDFKLINDRYGHLIGDQVLKQLGTLIKSAIRNFDYVGRYGGDEFIILFPDCDLKQGLKAANRVRETVENFAFINNLQLTLSGGLIEYSDFIKKHGETSICGLINEVDKLLYNSKNRGKNIISF